MNIRLTMFLQAHRLRLGHVTLRSVFPSNWRTTPTDIRRKQRRGVQPLPTHCTAERRKPFHDVSCSFAPCQRSTNPITDSNLRTRRVSRPSSNLNASRSSDHSFETRPSQMRRVAAKATPERQMSVIQSIENQKTRKDSSDCFSAMNSSSICRRNGAR